MLQKADSASLLLSASASIMLDLFKLASAAKHPAAEPAAESNAPELIQNQPNTLSWPSIQQPNDSSAGIYKAGEALGKLASTIPEG